MSELRTFSAQAAQQRDALRDRLAALEYIAEVNAKAEADPANGPARERGGLALDPVDPTRVTLPLLWLRALLNHARAQGYGAIANDSTMTALLTVWNEDYRTNEPEFDRLHESHPDLADRLREFLAIL